MKIPKKEPVDEIRKFVNSRFITASEAMWRMLSFDVHGRDLSIQCPAVHDENLQVVTFCEDKVEDTMANLTDTTLLAWFKLNSSDSNAHKFKYH